MLKFIHDDGDFSVDLTLDKEDVHIDEVFVRFEQFLRGAGYVFNAGDYIGLIKAEEVNPKCCGNCAGHGDNNVAIKNVGSNFPVI